MATGEERVARVFMHTIGADADQEQLSLYQ